MLGFSYDSDLIGGSLQVRESRIIADLLLRQADASIWQQEIQHENRLQKRSGATARRVAQALRKRLERLPPPFWQALLEGDEELATQVAFCAALERNLLMVEFMEDVVRDAYITHTKRLEHWQWSEFLDDRAHRDPAIADWAETSRRKMGQVVLRMLAEVGLLDSTRNLELQHMVVRPETVELLEHSGRQRLRACLEISAAQYP
ncbi:MAG: DUF1819 family protein [Pseudomonas profundi]|uniref:DUF1819 family protein n=1 Tax=Pseudomonas profundi TaxID=1981513 RepID=UPI0030025A4C